MFGTKKSQTQPEPVETIAAQEHKQSIGNQVMEALGVGENGTGLDEESEILMPKQNQRQLEAEGVVKESVCVISKDAVIGGGIDVKGDLMVAGKVMGHISASLKMAFSSSGFLPFCRLFSMSGTAARQRRKTLLGSIILMPNSITSRRLLSRHLSLKMGQSTCLPNSFFLCFVAAFHPRKRPRLTATMSIREPSQMPFAGCSNTVMDGI